MLQQLRANASQRRHRALLVIAGDPAWCKNRAMAALHQLKIADSIWIGDANTDEIATLNNDQALAQLGRECEVLIYNAHSGFDPDAFGALSGTLRGGGLLLLLTPPLSEWHTHPDPVAERIRVAGFDKADLTGRFLQRIANILQSDPDALIITPEATPSAPVNPEAFPPQIPLFNHPQCRTRDQLQAVDAIIRVVKGHRKRPLVLTSDRGRGKSSALGIAAARLIGEGYRDILVTAPRQAAVSSLFEQAINALPEAKSSPFSIDDEGFSIRFHAPDHLLSNPQRADLLLVDEAAAIPTKLLEGLLAHYPRVVFATTVHGYEGTGLGFNIRFKGHLDRHTPQWREVILTEPIRWSRNDPLEALVFRLLALDASPAPDNEVADVSLQEVIVEYPTQQQLLENEGDLNQLFGLLVIAHYRTTPLDLRHLLDGPNLRIALLRHRGFIVAVALLAAEGGFDEAMTERIWSGRRRPRGHLLAQSLSAHLGLPLAATLKGMRIMRIAVHPTVQNRGLGRLLVDSVRHEAEKTGFDYLGTSFGATPELIGFWLRCGLQAVRIGLRTGASSSNQSVMFLQPLSPHGVKMATEARQRFARQLPTLLGDSLAHLSSSLAAPLLENIEHPPTTTLDFQDWLDLLAFAFARRGYDLSLHAIQVITLAALADGILNDADAELLIKRVLQKQSWQVCASALKLTGRGATVQHIRQVVGRLVFHYAGKEIRERASRMQADNKGSAR
ncbi:MAG: GNAT family N-acetyltransferase [Candidatus Thiodiazotropha endolucinida]|uniref:tRNA(Met) cytidine acetyltransferase TmcA n=1 Tax=Candidatus Thiodiazotropha taylori TaxID=2792791 RepID=A0A9E4NGJ5_9GAMM|nr:GNAT family N-acetyltransferase [Candidatus Thiodiazotropha taylori]MCW4234874.1 GNAT family N-acetyltransferase [Candidatus Thiodiazotropha endolucinida]